jgi:hypothetical protein
MPPHQLAECLMILARPEALEEFAVGRLAKVALAP